MPRLVPVEDFVVVRPDDAETLSAGGLHIPERDADKPRQGVAVAVGPGRFTDGGVQVPVAVQAGERVLFAELWGEAVVLDGVRHLIGRERDLLGRFEDHSG